VEKTFRGQRIVRREYQLPVELATRIKIAAAANCVPEVVLVRGILTAWLLKAESASALAYRTAEPEMHLAREVVRTAFGEPST
jgi:hypothetical protein